jgi:hypothetical protein
MEQSMDKEKQDDMKNKEKKEEEEEFGKGEISRRGKRC